MRYEARVTALRSGRVVGSRVFDTAETAAGHLAVLMRADGCTVDRDTLIRSLASGVTFTHKAFKYQVTEVCEAHNSVR